MKPLPKPIGQFLQEWLKAKFTFGYILVDAQGIVRSWGGELKKLGLQDPRIGEPVSDQLLFTEGLFPIQVPSLYLPMIKVDSHNSLDLHLFETEDGCGLLLVDVTEHEQDITQWQQKANDMAREAERISRLAGSATDLYQALDIAALRLNVDGTFDILGQQPDWLPRYCPYIRDSHTSCVTLEGSLSFLENFLIEAREFWERNRVGCIRSGLWIETEEGGREHYFEAIAVTTAHEKILLITCDLGYFNEKQQIIQTGRRIAAEKDVLRSRHKELAASQDALEVKVQQRTRQLQEANIRLADELIRRRELEKERTEIMHHLQQSQKLEAIGTLAGGIAHDFNNILSAVLGFTELSLLEVEDNSKLHTNLNYVLHACNRAKDLVKQILTFSRQSKPENRPVQPKTIINETLKLMRASLPACVEIEQELESNAYIMADPSQLHQVILNLFTNAAHAMQGKGGVLFVRLVDINLQPAVMVNYPELSPGDYIELMVRDSGHGISEEILSKIFDPFFTTKEEGRGTGMGLAVVHGVVKSCNGGILVTSQPGVGTIFRILLPIVHASEFTRAGDVSAVIGGNERILFIDDEVTQVELAKQILGNLGYGVVAMTDCVQAIARFAENPDGFDLIISDVNMPQVSGWALTRKLREIRDDIPIILCSGYQDDPYQERLKDMEVQGYLEKPVSTMDMAKAIRQALDRGASQ